MTAAARPSTAAAMFKMLTAQFVTDEFFPNKPKTPATSVTPIPEKNKIAIVSILSMALGSSFFQNYEQAFHDRKRRRRITIDIGINRDDGGNRTNDGIRAVPHAAGNGAVPNSHDDLGFRRHF